MLASFTAGIEYQRGDVNQDGRVTIGDVTCLIDYLLTGSWDDEPVTPDDHEWVDLGLPSGTLWATCNVGASAPEEYGDFFAWGETDPEPKDYYDWGSYKWCYGSYKKLTKYCYDSDYGYNDFYDNKRILDPEDDAAYVNWGPQWRMPTVNQLVELKDNCTWKKTTRNGVVGCQVTGPNGNTLFLPFATIIGNNFDEPIGLYWALELASPPYKASALAFNGLLSPYGSGSERCDGRPVRAVCVP